MRYAESFSIPPITLCIHRFDCSAESSLYAVNLISSSSSIGYLTKEKLIESWFLEVIFYTFHNLQFLNSNNTSSLHNCKASCHFVSVSLNPIPIVSSSECIVPIRVVVINMW